MFLILNILHSWRRESSLKPNVSLTWFSQPWLAQKDQSPVALKSTTISLLLPVNLQVIQPTYLNQGVHNAPILSLFPLTDALHKCRVLGELLEAAGLESCIRTVLSGGCQGFDSPVGHQWAALPLDFCGAFSIIGTYQLCFWQLFVQLSTLNQRRSPSVREITPMEHRLPPPAGIESFLFSGRHKNVQGSWSLYSFLRHKWHEAMQKTTCRPLFLWFQFDVRGLFPTTVSGKHTVANESDDLISQTPRGEVIILRPVVSSGFFFYLHISSVQSTPAWKQEEI